MSDLTRDGRETLCKTCTLSFATCKSNPKFGNGKGNDNVVSCDKYDKVMHVEEYEATGIGFCDDIKNIVMKMADEIRRVREENLELKEQLEEAVGYLKACKKQFTPNKFL